MEVGGQAIRLVTTMPRSKLGRADWQKAGQQSNTYIPWMPKVCLLHRSTLGQL